MKKQTRKSIELSDFQLFAAITFFVVLINAWFWLFFFIM